MATENVVYLTTQEAIKFHILYMRKVGETRFGVFDRNLIESALSRPQNAALYENADVSAKRQLWFSVLSKITRGKAETSAPQLF